MTANVFYIAIGGAIGAVGRHTVEHLVTALVGTGFPYGTLAVNVIGGFVLGAFIEISALAWSPPPELRAMLVVGVLGAFTTFSTFSLDAVTLMTRGETASALIYVLASVVLSIGAVWAGMALFRGILA